MLYTKKGDTGTTKFFGCDQRFSKSSQIAEALGTVDETNSWIGLCRIKSGESKLDFSAGVIADILQDIQHDLFIVQAEIAGADKHLDHGKVMKLETVIDQIEKELPPIKSFFLPGACELSVLFDIARTVSRRAEREVVKVKEEGLAQINDTTGAYLNRLSSILYAFARLANTKAGVPEEPPHY